MNSLGPNARIWIFIGLLGVIAVTLAIAAIIAVQLLSQPVVPTLADTATPLPTQTTAPTSSVTPTQSETPPPAAPPGAPGTPDMDAASDSGLSDSDNLTNDTTPRFTGTCTDGEWITLISNRDGVLNPAQVLCSGGQYDITLTSFLSEGDHQIVAVAQNAAGDTGPASPPITVVIDTTAPTVPGAPDLVASSDTGISNTDNVTADNTPQFTGFCSGGDRITLLSSIHGELAPSTTCNVNVYDITVSTPLSTGTHTITARAMDAAGNTSLSGGLTIVIETASPSAPGIPDLHPDSDTGSSNSDNITSDTTPRFTGSCATGDTITLISSLDGERAPSVTCANGGYDITLSQALREGTHTITARATNPVGMTTQSGSLAVTIDLTAPNPPGAPDLHPDSDTGSSNSDNITSDTTPRFTGACTTGDRITLHSNVAGALVPGGVLCSNNLYDITLTNPLNKGTHTITATAQDPAGNTSTPSPGLVIDIESAAGTPGTPDLHPDSDSGASNSDNITNDTTPRFTGSCLSGDQITLHSSVDGDLAPADVPCSGGQYDITLTSVLSEGTHNITATAKNNAGQTSAPSAPLSLTIDTAAPPVPGTPDLDAGSDTGSSNSDNITSDTTPRFIGACENNTTVTLTSSLAGALTPSVTCTGGVYDITVSAALSENTHQITATQVDLAGNSSPSSGALSVTISIPTLAVSLSGNQGSDAIVSSGGNPVDGPLNCPSTRCDTDFALDDSVTLSIVLDPASTFSGWGGDCASFGTNLSGVLTMNADKTCTATFAPAPAPEIDVEGNGVSIADGDNTPAAADHTDFGDVTVGSTLDRTFTIQNEGSADLTLTDFPNAVTLSGAGEFTIQSQPAAGTIAPAGSQTFTVRCAPAAAGSLSATVSIASNDTDENPYDFTLACNGVGVPEIDIQRPAGNSLADGSTDNLGDQPIGTVNVQYTIDNSAGSGDLTVSAVNAANLTNADAFTVNTALPLTIPATQSATLDISFNVPAAGAFSLDMSIANDDADENPYDLTLSGNGVTAPEIDIQRPAGNSLADGSTDDLGTQSTGTVYLQYIVDNSAGSAALNITSVTAANLTNVSNFAVGTSLPLSVPAGQTATLEVSFDVPAAGAFSLDLSIANDDADENPYDLTLSGTGGTAPEINILGNDVIIYSGDTTPDSADHTDFGSVDVNGATVTRTFTIQNIGTADLTLSGTPIVTIGGPNAADFSLTADATSPVTAGGQTTFTLTFDPSASGLRQATISIASNDSDENPYTFAIQGTGSGPAPEMDVLGNGVSIPSGDTSPSSSDSTDFGNVTVGNSQAVTFTIVNTGSVDLNLSGTPIVAVSGPNAADFAVTATPSTPVAAGGGTTTFEITFTPSATGLRQATISIANDDSDENPYTFAIQGTGN